jgi:molecular chaperone GrpE (heat shock protein)
MVMNIFKHLSIFVLVISIIVGCSENTEQKIKNPTNTSKNITTEKSSELTTEQLVAMHTELKNLYNQIEQTYNEQKKQLNEEFWWDYYNKTFKQLDNMRDKIGGKQESSAEKSLGLAIGNMIDLLNMYDRILKGFDTEENNQIFFKQKRSYIQEDLESVKKELKQ